MTRKSILPIAIAAVSAFAVAAIGGSMTVIDEWYFSLQQPAWVPPPYMFGVIWTAVFALIALAGVFAWERANSRREKEMLLGMFALNGFLNLLWSFLFFRLQRPDLAFYELIVFWISIAALIVICGRFSKLSSLLLMPYLIWVSIAGVLNYEVVRLNGPFG
jgi:tryptophan-rich sensory protein